MTNKIKTIASAVALISFIVLLAIVLIEIILLNTKWYISLPLSTLLLSVLTYLGAYLYDRMK